MEQTHEKSRRTSRAVGDVQRQRIIQFLATTWPNGATAEKISEEIELDSGRVAGLLVPLRGSQIRVVKVNGHKLMYFYNKEEKQSATPEEKVRSWINAVPPITQKMPTFSSMIVPRSDVKLLIDHLLLHDALPQEVEEAILRLMEKLG